MSAVISAVTNFSKLEEEASFAERRMDIKIENILPALAENLYGNDWHVALRELLQNAHDAITQREIEEEHGHIRRRKDFGGNSIRVWIDAKADDRAIIFQDDGIGLTSEEIHKYIATIGETGKALADLTLAERKKLIGYFGIGFLAAFIIGKKVTVFSQSATKFDVASAVAVFEGRTEYRNGTTGTKFPQGTVVRVTLKDEFSDASRYPDTYLLDFQTLSSAIRRCASNFTTPIFLHNGLQDGTGQLVTSEKVPWDGEQKPTIEQFRKYLAERRETFGDIAHLETFHFTTHPDGVDAHGVVYFPKGPTGFGSFGGDIYPNILFVRRMHVATGMPGLLPSWFLFAGVVVECADLSLNLSRDRVIETDEKYVLLRQRISEFLLKVCSEWAGTASFLECYSGNRERFTHSLVNSNNEDDRRGLFRVLAPAIPFEVRSSRFRNGTVMNLADYEKAAVQEKGALPKSDDSAQSESTPEELLYLYLLTSQDQGRLRAIAVQQSYPVLYINSEMQEDTLLAYTNLRRVDGQTKVRALEVRNIWGVDPISSEDERRFNELRILCLDVDARLGISEVKLGRFQPASVPAILVSAIASPKEAELIEHFLAQGQDMLSVNVVRYLRSQSDQIRLGKKLYTLFLNVTNDYLKELADYLNAHQGDQEAGKILVGEVVLNAALPLFDDPSLTERILSLRSANALRGVRLRTELSRKEKENTFLRAEIARKLDPLDAADLRNVPRDIQKRTGAVLVLDLVKSTWMVGNVDLRDSGEIFDDFVSTVARIVQENGGHFDKFTGDGLLAEFFASGEDEASRQSAARSAYECAKSLVVNIGNFFQREPWRSLLVDAALTGPKMRVAISWGPVYFGRYCGVGTAVGSPMIQAARLCAAKDFFGHTQQSQTAYSVIGTAPVFELAHLPVKEAAERQITRDWPIEGLGPVTIFGLYP